MNNEISEQDKKEFKKICRRKIPKTIISFVNKHIDNPPTKNELLSFVDVVSKSDKTFSEYVNFADCFARSSETFKFMAKNHVLMSSKYPQYYQYFKKIKDSDEKFRKLVLRTSHNLGSITDDFIMKK